MSLATWKMQTTRRLPTPSTLIALAGIAWASCAIAQTVPTGRPGSVQQENQDPNPGASPTLDDARRLLQQGREQLTPNGARSNEEVVDAGAGSPGGGINSEGKFSIDIEGPMDLSAFVDLVSEALQINIIEDAALQGHTVVFRAPLAIPMDEVLDFLRALLADAGFALVYDDLGFYRIRLEQNIMPDFSGPLPTTRIISTPLVRPSALQTLIAQQVGGTPTFRLTPIDELNILMVTGTPASLDMVDQLAARLLTQVSDQKFFPFRLQNVSAVYARSRIIQLNGQSSPTAGGGNINPQAAAAASVNALSSLDTRLFLDQGNTLLFKGTPDEAKRVANLIEVVDVVAPLIVKRYVAGSVAMEAARAGERLGLGPVSTLDQGNTGFQQRNRVGGNQQQISAAMEAEPAVSGFTVDVETGSIIYYGTESQHAAVDRLVQQFKETSLGENIEIRAYKLLYAKAEGGDNEEGGGVAAILQQLIENPQETTTRSPLIPETAGRAAQNAPPEVSQILEDAGIGVGDAGATRLIATTENTIIVSDPARNQIIIKAPAKAQEQFARIIKQLDQKQPQVMIEVKIVAVTMSDNFKWAADVQFNFGQFSWFSGFGVTSAPESGSPFDPRVFPTPDGVSGLTTGIIKSDYIPVAIQVLESVGKTKVISNPQILVNDNTEASMASEREVPYSASSQGTSTTITSQGGTAKAGTTLNVTPRISEGGDITLDFEAELSDFTGPASGGLQPPAQRDTYQSSVTLPSDSTVVVGGFRLDRNDKQESKVPIIGDIPLLGSFFKSYNHDLTNSVIFVFITPRVMRDPYGADLQLITEGPMAEVELEPDVPTLEPALMPIVGSLGGEERLLPTNPAADVPLSRLSDRTGPASAAAPEE